MGGQINRLAHYESLSFLSFIEYIIICNFNSLRFKYSGIWHVTGRVVPSILRDCGVFIFRVFILHGLLNTEDVGTTILWNTVNFSPCDTLLYPRTPECTAVLLWEPQISQWIIYFSSHGYICPCHASNCEVNGICLKLYKYVIHHFIIIWICSHKITLYPYR